jgi:hypothetical protein
MLNRTIKGIEMAVQTDVGIFSEAVSLSTDRLNAAESGSGNGSNHHTMKPVAVGARSTRFNQSVPKP